MEKTGTLKFRILDLIYILMMILPFVCGIVIKVLTEPAKEGISITGAGVFFSVPMPLQDFVITESQVNSWLVMVAVIGLCLYLAHGITAKGGLRRQVIAEWIVEKTDGLINENMGEFFAGFSPFIAAMLALSAFSSLITLLGLYAPTSDINVVGGWAILVFILITHYKMKCGPLQYIKSFGEPVKFLMPLNLISEVATPLSMAFRHYGNILSGSVISVLVAYALGNLSKVIMGRLPGFLASIPILRIGLPAVLSAYFDVFSGLLQAYIFSMLTMLYVAGAFPAELYFEKKKKKADKKRRAAEVK